MYRKVVFSKEPTVLKLESANTSDDAAFIHLKHRSRAFYIGARRDQFGVYPGDLAISTLNQAYFTVTPVNGSDANAPVYQLNCDQLKTHRVACSSVRFTNDAQITTNPTTPGHLNFKVPSEHHVFQFGNENGSEPQTPWVTLRSNVFHFNGDICCERVYTSNVSVPSNTATAAGAAAAPPSFPLDKNGKIPMEYLPELYKTSLIHNTAGVGIGTESPLQKFHLEGNGLIRGRLAIGGDTSQDAIASAALHLRPSSATTAIRIDTDTMPAFELYEIPNSTGQISPSPTPVVQIGLREIHFQPPIHATSMTVDELIVPNQLEFQHHRVNILTPTHIKAPLTVRTIASEDAVPLVLNAPSVQCSNISTAHWTLPLSSEAPYESSSTSIPPTIPMTFQGAKVCLCDGTLTLNDGAWKAAYQSGDELARLTMPDASHIDMTRVIAFLWNTVQELRQRVDDLENKKS